MGTKQDDFCSTGILSCLRLRLKIKMNLQDTGQVAGEFDPDTDTIRACSFALVESLQPSPP